ncbi:MAG: hypothetical protein ACK5MQ_02040 [Pikeienuella sp.]
MSFFRPEAIRLMFRWAETALYTAMTLGGALWLLDRGAVWWLALIPVVAGGLLIRSAALSALAAREAAGSPGIVTVDERRIAYFGPYGGMVVSLDDIFEIEIFPPDEPAWRYEPVWALRWSPTESAVLIPASAEGADRLIDAFAALPGFAPMKALAALKSGHGAGATIWRREDAPAFPALARSGGAD